MRTDPASLEAYVAAAWQLRSALMPLAERGPELRARTGGEAFERARQARARFLSSASGLARRERKLAAHWENAAVLRYLHGRDAFARAEELGNRLISHLAPEKNIRLGGAHRARGDAEAARVVLQAIAHGSGTPVTGAA